MDVRAFSLGILACALTALAACGEEHDEANRDDMLRQDPQLARALHDPLMVDPDLSWRNEANAVIAFREGHPLPPFEMHEEAARRAREAARLELLETGPISSLPAYSSDGVGVSLGQFAYADEMALALGANRDCISLLDGDLRWSTRLPEAAAIMPHGMVQQAAGVDRGECDVRIVRYLAPVGIDDVLDYHHAKADRARFDVVLYDDPEAQLVADRRDRKLSVNARPGTGGMTAVDIVYWQR